jgi:hypothetical protein
VRFSIFVFAFFGINRNVFRANFDIANAPLMRDRRIFLTGSNTTTNRSYEVILDAAT